MKKTKDRITSMLNAITSSGSGGSEGTGEPMKVRAKSEPHETEASGQAKSATSRFKSLRERFQQHMAAAAYAEAGEFEAAAELTEPAVTSKTVLLVIEGESPSPEPFAYALNLCKRTNAELDLLQVIEQSRERENYELLSHKMIEGSRNIVALVRQLEGEDIPFKVTIRLGDVSQKLFNYARRHKDVAMVIFDSPSLRKGSEMSQTWSRLLENISHQLSIPLITVEQKEGMPLPVRG
jgi:K+-sensing histidine kinase KdpD